MQSVSSIIKQQAMILSTCVIAMWVSEILDQSFFRHSLDYFGILPRNFVGLRGIIFAPLLHGNFTHLLANTIPFITLGWLVMLQEVSDFFIVTAIAMLVGGLGTWLFGTPGLHIGASGVIFGYIGFLLARGYFDRRLSSILISLFVGTAYGTTLFGLFPTSYGVSWEGHLFGFIGGIIAAKIMTK